VIRARFAGWPTDFDHRFGSFAEEIALVLMAGFSILFQHRLQGAVPDFASLLSPADLPFTLLTAVGAFVSTNLDDILLLLLFFSQIRQRRDALAIVAGQYLGLGLLVSVSLSGQLGRSFLPGPWLGLLGLLPISLAVSRWLATEPGHDAAADAATPAAGALAVAALTLANGSDNIGVYLPLFARADAGQALLTLAVFAVMVALWCVLAWWLVQAPGLGDRLRRHGPRLMGAVLVALGLVLLIDAHTFAHRGLALLALLALAAMAAPLARRPAPSLGLLPSPSSRFPSP
jgi:cadmium resistance protein CadD (predicted permease)